MSSNNKQKLSDINVDNIVFMLSKIIGSIILIWAVFWCYFVVYNPKERNYIKNTRYAYKLIEKEAMSIFRNDGFIFEKDEVNDKLCTALANKYNNGNGNCAVSKGMSLAPNFKIGKTKITIYGMNMKPFESNGTLVKDIVIDVNGDKGENTYGVDRIPVTVYSSGRMGGMLSPVNCSIEDRKRYDMYYSPLCTPDVTEDYYAINRPLAYNIVQIGGKKGTSKIIGANVSFLRADCAAYGAELLGMDEFCEQRGFHWLTACYHDYYCAIEIADKI